MGCGSAKISLSHVGRRSGDRGGGGKRRQGHSDYSDSDPEDSDSEHHGGAHYEKSRLAGGSGSGATAARSAPALVTSASVDSEFQKPDRKHPKIITSFSQNDFTTTTNINGRGRIRVTLSHDGSLLEVETEMLNLHPTVEESATSSLQVASSSTAKDRNPSPRNRNQPPVWALEGGTRDEALPSCSGTNMNAGRSSGSRSDISGQGLSTSEHESTSNSANSFSTPRYNDVRHERGEVVPSGGCDTEDEDDAPTAGTVFITVAEIEDRPVSTRAHRSKSINSILSQAEESLRQELTRPKQKRSCKECGCIKDGEVIVVHNKSNVTSPDEGRGHVDNNQGGISVISLDNDIEKCDNIANQNIIQSVGVIVGETVNGGADCGTGTVIPSPDTDLPDHCEGRTNTDKVPNKIRQCSEDHPSPLLIDKYVQCCCYCHQYQRGSDRKEIKPTNNGNKATTGQSKVNDLNPGLLPGQTDIKNNHNSNGQSTSCNSHTEKESISTAKSKLSKLKKSKLFGRSESKENGNNNDSASSVAVCNGRDSSSAKEKDKKGAHKTCNAHSVDFGQCKNKSKATFKSRNFLGHSHDGVLSNDTIVTVPVAPIVDANAVFDFDDYEWAELALGKTSNSKKKSTSPTRQSKSMKNKKCAPGDISTKEGPLNFKENKTFQKIKSLSSNQLSLASTAASSNSHSSSRFSITSDQCKCTLRRSKTTSSGSIAEMADGPLSSLSQQSVNTFMTPSLSMDSASLPSSQGSLDNPAIWLQVHTDFFNDFYDFCDEDDTFQD